MKAGSDNLFRLTWARADYRVCGEGRSLQKHAGRPRVSTEGKLFSTDKGRLWILHSAHPTETMTR